MGSTSKLRHCHYYLRIGGVLSFGGLSLFIDPYSACGSQSGLHDFNGAPSSVRYVEAPVHCHILLHPTHNADILSIQ